MEIIIQKLTDQDKISKQIDSWPIWEKEVSRFDWYYDSTEHCYILKGKVIVETNNGNIEINAGDYVTFPKGLKCIWDIKEDIRKHYKFE